MLQVVRKYRLHCIRRWSRHERRQETLDRVPALNRFGDTVNFDLPFLRDGKNISKSSGVVSDQSRIRARRGGAAQREGRRGRVGGSRQTGEIWQLWSRSTGVARQELR